MKQLWGALAGAVIALSVTSAQAACPRIVSQSPYITRALEWLGQGGCVVGVSRYDERALPQTGGVRDPDTAAIAALRPDLLLVSAGTPDTALVLSACSGSPYSFGREHVVGDAFVKAGFDVVESVPRVRHLRAGEEVGGIDEAIARFKPDVVFSLTPRNPLYCDARLGSLPVRVVFLHGDNFFNPGPAVIDGLTELAERMKP